MGHNTRLAIAISTYNRAHILEDNIVRLLPDLLASSVPIYISDDSDNFETQAAVSRLKARYPYIYYNKNTVRLGHDGNFFVALNLPNSDYVWYLGDGIFIYPTVLSDVLDTLQSDVDFCFLNSRIQHQVSKFISVDEMRSFLYHNAWHLTLSGATIYGRKVRSIFISEQKKREWKNFVQLGLIFEYCSRSEATAYWKGSFSIAGNEKKGASYWAQKAFDVFVLDWTCLISSFLGFLSQNEIRHIVRSHAAKTGIFNIRTLAQLRLEDRLNLEIFDRYRNEIDMAIPLPLWVVKWISGTKKWVCRLLIRWA